MQEVIKLPFGICVPKSFDAAAADPTDATDGPAVGAAAGAAADGSDDEEGMLKHRLDEEQEWTDDDDDPVDPGPGGPGPAGVAKGHGKHLQNKGLKAFEVSPSSRCECFICKAKIAKGAFRFDYRLKESSSLRDQLRCHALCVKHVPLDTRVADIAFVKSLLDAAQTAGQVGSVDALSQALRVLGG